MTCCRKLYGGGIRKKNLLKYKYIQFNQPTSQVVLNPGDILVVNTNWWFHETKVLQESLKSSALFEFKPRYFLENSVSQWLVNLIRSTSQAAGCGMIVIIHQNMDLQDKMEYSLFLSNVRAFPPIKSWALSYLEQDQEWCTRLLDLSICIVLDHRPCFIRHVCTSVFHNRHHACVWYCIIRKRVS